MEPGSGRPREAKRPEVLRTNLGAHRDSEQCAKRWRNILVTVANDILRLCYFQAVRFYQKDPHITQRPRFPQATALCEHAYGALNKREVGRGGGGLRGGQLNHAKAGGSIEGKRGMRKEAGKGVLRLHEPKNPRG